MEALPVFSELSDALYAPFPVRPFSRPQIVWLNTRWMSGRGMDISPPAKAGFSSWLLKHYGLGVPQRHDPENSYSGKQRIMFADRYGSNAGSTHGGSGRVGVLGGFSAKGVGQTPLVSLQTDWYHSHGCMWLEEAVREAINSEVFQRELPHGAVPTIAIIDTGERINWAPGDAGERRAILVRPAFLRLASLQRSIFHGDAGHPQAAQYLDAIRTRELWAALFPPVCDAQARLCALFEKIGEQYGCANAKRLWPGPFFSSNVTLSGALADFGGARAIWSWRRGRGDTQNRDFGGELGFAQATARAIARTAGKYNHAISPTDLVAAFSHGRDMGFERALPRAGATIDRAFVELMRTSFDRQQRVRGQMADDHGETWLSDARGAGEVLSHAAQVERQAIDSRWTAIGGRPATLAAFLRPRFELMRESLLRDCQNLIADMDRRGSVCAQSLTEFIDQRLAVNHQQERDQ